MNKQCNKCRVSQPVECFSLNRKAKDGLQGRCKSCQRKENRASYTKNREKHKQRYRDNHAKIRTRQKLYRAKHRENYKRVADRYRSSVIGRSKGLYKAAEIRAKRINVDFNLTFDRVHDAVDKGECERTGVKFDLKPHGRMQNNPFAPSVDRIDSFGPYSDENVQIVCVAYNIGKNQMTDEQYIDFCRLVAEKNT